MAPRQRLIVLQVEKTPYRVIVTHIDGTNTYTDAFTVMNSDRIIGVNKFTKTNAWGYDLPQQTTYSLIFAENLPKTVDGTARAVDATP